MTDTQTDRKHTERLLWQRSTEFDNQSHGSAMISHNYYL